MASREREDAMAGLVKRSLAGDAGAGNSCPEPDILAAYFERSLDPEETARLELHFSQCARCREHLAALGHAERGVVGPAASAPPKAARASWLWDWRWLAPVAAILVIAAIWATRPLALTQIAQNRTTTSSGEAPESTTHPSAQSTAPEQQQIRAATRRLAPETTDKVAPRAAAAPPAGAPQDLQSAPSFGANAGIGLPAASIEKSGTPNLVSPKSIESPTSNAREYAKLKKLPEAPSAAKATADEASNAPMPAGDTANLTVESAESPVPTPTPASPSNSGATIGGVAGGVVPGAASGQMQTSDAKQALVRTHRSRPEVAAATQMGETSTSNAVDFGERVIHTPNPKILWRFAVTEGFVERSEDGGASWLGGHWLDQNARFNAGSAPAAKVCWLVGDGGIILLTEDASNWQVIPAPVTADFVAINARNASTATVIAADGRRFTTTNRGKSWKPAQ
jgi:Putative zinc-finger